MAEHPGSSPLPPRRAAAALVGSALAGAIGLLPGSTGGTDPVGLLAWLALTAPALGALCGASGARLWPYGWAVPGTWLFLLIWADLSSSRDLASPIWAACVVGGLFAFGVGVGILGARRPVALAGLLAFATLVLATLPVLAGLSRRGWGEKHPALAKLLLEVSPLVLVTECAGWDWTHSHPEVYRLSGVEWFQRRPHRGPLAGPVVLLVGCAAAYVVSKRTRLPEPSEDTR